MGSEEEEEKKTKAGEEVPAEAELQPSAGISHFVRDVEDRR